MHIGEAVKDLEGRKAKKRVGRGAASGLGKTCGRGNKGAKARTGYSRRAQFEGGQMPLFRRIPKRGFSNDPFRTLYCLVNVGDLKAHFKANDSVDTAALKAARLVRRDLRVKLLGMGEIDIPLKLKVCAASKAAREKIEAAGGSVEIVNR